jgi:6-phosphogluconolactonase (cycloisomerase 2 family)
LVNNNSLILTDSAAGTLTGTGTPYTAFTETGLAPGTTYAITVQAQPTAPAQNCVVANGSGTISASAPANVTGVTVTCRTTGQYLYVANENDDNGTDPNGTVASFAINPTSGVLTAVTAPVHTPDTSPRALAVDPTGNFLYVGNETSNNISTHVLATGAITTADASVVPTNNTTSSPLSLAINPAGFVYAGGADNTPVTAGLSAPLMEYSVANGVLTLANTYPATNLVTGLAFDSTYAFLYTADAYASNISSYPVGSGALGAPNDSTSGVTGGFYWNVAVSGNFVYVTDQANNTVTLITATSGVLAAGPYTSTTLPGFNIPQGIVVDPTGSYLYVADKGSGSVYAYTIAPTTGLLTAITGSPFASLTPAPTGLTTAGTWATLAVDPSGQFLYSGNADAGTVTAFTIGAGGVLTAVGTPVSTVATGGGPTSLAIF